MRTHLAAQAILVDHAGRMDFTMKSFIHDLLVRALVKLDPETYEKLMNEVDDQRSREAGSGVEAHPPLRGLHG